MGTRTRTIGWASAGVLCGGLASWLGCSVPPAGMGPDSGARYAGTLAFVRLTDGYWQIWERDLASGRKRQRTTSPADKRYPRWDAEGGLYFRTNDDELYYLASAARAEVPILRDHWPARDPAVHGRAAAVAFARVRKDVPDHSAVVRSGGAGEPLRFLTGSAGLRMHLDWSPDGERIAYVLTRGPLASEIRDVSASGGEPRVLVGGDARNLHPAYAPDGRTLAFVSNRSGDFEIWLRDEDGTETRLTETPGREWAPAWSPDGRALAFATARRGHPEIWVTDARGAAAIPLVESTAPSMDPDWRR